MTRQRLARREGKTVGAGNQKGRMTYEGDEEKGGVS